MAGNFGAIQLRPPLPPLPKFCRSLFKLSNSSSALTFNPIFLSSSYSRLSCRSRTIMAENGDQTQSPQFQRQNGVEFFDSFSFFRVKKLSDKAVLPSRASTLSAGYDLSSAVDAKVPARGKALIATDLSIAVPEGTYARIAPRSGLAWKHSIDVGAGVIDADYRGPVGVILFNHSDFDFEVKVRDRIAQLIIQKIVTPDVFEVEDLDSTVRGAGGFGSTGV